MQKIDQLVALSPTDIANHLACKHLTWLNLRSIETGIAPRQLDDDLLEVLKSYGEAHEQTYLKTLKSSLESLKRTVVDLDARRDKESAYTRDELIKRMAATATAMKAGRDALYQPTFYSETDGFGWVGRADFLVAVDEVVSSLGNYAFEPYDTKLARIAKVNALIQLCAYAEQIQQVQGTKSEYIHVVTGSEEEGTVSVRLSEVSAYYRRVKQSLVDALLESPEHSEPVPNEHCNICRWRAECNEHWRKTDDLTFVASLSATNRDKLRAAGVATLEQLATLETIDADINTDVLGRLRDQAKLQELTRKKRLIEPDSQPEFRFLRPVQLSRGFSLLPEPTPGDIFYDIEGHPYRGSKGLEYLHGLAWVEADGTNQYKAFWAHNAEGERQALIQVIDFINSRIALAGYENLRVYHFGHYEPSALKRLATQHVTYETELGKLLREGRFVDLSRVVTQAMRIGVESYSIKKLEQMYGFERNDLVDDGKLSIVCYEEWLASRTTTEFGPDGDTELLDDLIAYNRNDCLSTIELRKWLEAQRELLARELPAEELVELVRLPLRPLEEEAEIGAGLVEQLNAGRFDRLSEEEAAPLQHRWLLADLLDFHKREAAVDGFEFVQLVRMSDEELFDSPSAIAGLQFESSREFEAPKKKNGKYSEIRRYHFDPSQVTRIDVGTDVTAPNYHQVVEVGTVKPKKPSLEVIALDLDNGVIDLKVRHNEAGAEDPSAIFINEHFPKDAFEAALEEIALSLLANNEAKYPATYQLLRRLPARLKPAVGELGPVAKERPWQEVSAIVQALDDSYLAVQGPPGTGKTYTASNVILDLVKQGKRIGITTNSYSAFEQLLDEIVAQAEDHGFDGVKPVRVLAKSRDENSNGEPGSAVAITRRVDAKRDIAPVAKNFDIVAGTSFLFAREDMRNSVDVLFVDEAGQLSLADTLAVSLSAKDLVLVGDPQQLKQPTKAAHPGESGLSALEYINSGHDVVPEGYGLLLGTTKRMHPTITDFVSEQVYEGKLLSAPGLEHQAVSGGDWLSGSGLRWFPVEHSGRSTYSPEEAAAVVETFYAMLGREFTNKDGVRSSINADGIFVITPYNLQKSELLRKLTAHPDAATHGVTEDRIRKRVGTVDKAQGDEAPVVLVSYTSSSEDDIPRGMDFLYSKNRFNVAVSRARALVVVFASPRLLDVNCKTIEQVRLANMLCRYAEVAQSR